MTPNYSLPRFIGIIALIGLFISAKAQPINFMILGKQGNGKKYTFYEGQEITYKLKTDIGYFTDKIVKLKDSVIEFATYTVAYADIEKVRIDKKKYLIPNKAVWVYGGNILAASAVLELAYLINTGSGIYNLGTQMLYLAAPVPLVLLANWVYGKFVKTEYTLSADEYQLRPVILRKD